ncbi:DUF2231 domain-containing protein [Aquabacterium fontiphilum]|jgi:uncharacterized membrane protein|uniref:DUF2231 domain-containing protein n=1 Tax=Aquabacterium fontiphilum TaxID=450365 RepID=UPI001378877E|nr:DUF2231 domain-containing protein [Aquabacterium fontiphilum]NBD21033.1 DUF2231 domain-containing protein [Aquabacterium fontiphilum]
MTDRPAPTAQVLDPIHSRVRLAGHPLHPMLVHFPVAMLLAVLGADLGHWLTGDGFWQRAALWLAGVGAAGGWVAGAVGTADWMLTRRIRNLVTAACHGVAAVMMLSIATLSWYWRWLAGPAEEPLWLAVLLSVLAAALVGLASMLGGRLVYEQAVGVVTSR